MRIIVIILFFIFPISIFGQIEKKIKIVNGITNKPIPKIYCYIIEGDDKWVGIDQTNKKGIFKSELWKVDSTAKYYVDISNSKYKPLRKEINIFDKKRLKLKLYPDSSYVEKTENLTYKECGGISFGYYFPKEPQSIYDLPDSIRIKLESHLINRLGKDFYNKLELNGGQIVNLDRLYIVEDNAKNLQWTPYSYYLCFSFNDVSKGIGLYTSKIVLDKHGNIIEEIGFPRIKDSPNKGNLISISQAKKIAKEKGFYNDKTNVFFSYDKEADSLTWCFKQTTYHENHTLSGSTWVIDAHNGEYLKKYGHGGIWD